MKIVFSNISGGLIFGGQTYGELIFQRVDLAAYIKFFRRLELDILTLSEVCLEDTDGNSMMADQLSKALKFPHFITQDVEESHLGTSKRLGTAILSRYPIVGNETLRLKSPKIEIDRPDGQHWIMHDKGAQRVVLDTPDGPIDITTVSYFPFHHFNRRLDEPAFAPERQAFVDFLLASTNPAIIAGDFNNKYVQPLKRGFPELFDTGFKEGIIASTTVIGFPDQQLDHILYQSRHFTATNGFVAKNGSDHYAVGVTLLSK